MANPRRGNARSRIESLQHANGRLLCNRASSPKPVEADRRIFAPEKPVERVQREPGHLPLGRSVSAFYEAPHHTAENSRFSAIFR